MASSYILNDQKMFCDIADGVAIVINSETGIYYGMNTFGTAVFENILNGASTKAIVDALQAIPDTPKDMEQRLDAFISLLLEKELIKEKRDAGDVTANLAEELAQSCAFNLEVKEFDDAQELLLADPIHEVKEDVGWKPEKDALETDKKLVAAKEAKEK